MGRVLEIIPASALAARLPKLIGVEMDVIFKNSVVLHGSILKVSGNQILFKDKILNKHKFELQEIEELVLTK